jgi:nucleoside-diphosphate-sugar epimerase
MTKIAIIGANGQVGAELCLLLAARPGMEIVPICRNSSGSAFLRWQGLACRHGRAADSADAARLLGDCDVIVNSSLAGGTPADIRRIEDRIIQNMFAHSKPGATIIHFSTQSVYGDPRAARLIRWRSPYGRVKLATERRVRSSQRRFKKAAYILRLGHVCGALQEISISVRSSVRGNAVILPSRDNSSNTVYTAAIVGAIEQIIRGATAPGTYDLMNTPPWTWREVYEYEAAICGTSLRAQVIDAPAPAGAHRRLLRFTVRVAAAIASAQRVRDLAAEFFAHLPDKMNARAMAWWFSRRARGEIAAVDGTRLPAEHLSWVENGENYFPAETPTIELLPQIQYSAGDTEATSWPADLPSGA